MDGGKQRFRSLATVSTAEPESATKGQLVQIAIVYGTDRTITAYRNGRTYGTGYTADSLTTFPPVRRKSCLACGTARRRK